MTPVAGHGVRNLSVAVRACLLQGGESPNPLKVLVESAGKSASKKGTAGWPAGSSAGRPPSLEKQRNGTAPIQSALNFGAAKKTPYSGRNFAPFLALKLVKNL